MKILIVEDEKEIARYLQKTFEMENFIVETARNGEDGSNLACSKHYDAVILDNVLPQKNGIEVCHDIRNKGIDTPIIMLSVRSEVNTKISLLNAGADDYLTKPFSFDELLARVNALLRRPKKMSRDILHIDDLALDLKHYKVRRGRREIKLTRKEFMLLEYMVKNAGQVLSRGMILENIWGASADIFSNTIESHIASLRKKIDIDGHKKLILTVIGRGYKIDAI